MLSVKREHLFSLLSAMQFLRSDGSNLGGNGGNNVGKRVGINVGNNVGINLLVVYTFVLVFIMFTYSCKVLPAFRACLKCLCKRRRQVTRRSVFFRLLHINFCALIEGG